MTEEGGFQYRRIGNRVLLRGRVIGGTASLVATLPEGFRPRHDIPKLPVMTELGGGVISILADGSVLAPVDSGWVSFEGIEFLVG